MKAAIVIPAYNEAATVGRVVESVRAKGQPIVVDDGSADETGARAEAAGAIVVRHAGNRGYDAALASGLARAEELGVDIAITFDADGQHDPDVLDRFIAPIADGDADLVIGLRPRPARVSERLFSLYARLRFGVPDILCGLKAFAMPLYRAHRGAAGRNSINTALTLRALAAGARFVLVDVPTRPRADAPRFGSALRANFRIFKAMLGAIAADLAGGRR